MTVCAAQKIAARVVCVAQETAARAVRAAQEIAARVVRAAQGQTPFEKGLAKTFCHLLTQEGRESVHNTRVCEFHGADPRYSQNVHRKPCCTGKKLRPAALHRRSAFLYRNCLQDTSAHRMQRALQDSLSPAAVLFILYKNIWYIYRNA